MNQLLISTNNNNNNFLIFSNTLSNITKRIEKCLNYNSRLFIVINNCNNNLFINNLENFN